jgi:regulator of sigma E protease
MLITIIIFILVLSVLVFAHELGHFMTARFFGVKAEEFGFGFPPRAIGWYKNEQKKWRKIVGNKEIDNPTTIYSLNWLPIGGFVKIKGEDGEGRTEKNSFAAKPIWQRVIILVAGVTMNIVLAWFLFSLGYLMGLPQSTDSLGRGAIVSEAQVMVAQVMPNSIAAQAGLKEGDAILRVGSAVVGSEKALQDEIAK